MFSTNKDLIPKSGETCIIYSLENMKDNYMYMSLEVWGYTPDADINSIMFRIYAGDGFTSFSIDNILPYDKYGETGYYKLTGIGFLTDPKIRKDLESHSYQFLKAEVTVMDFTWHIVVQDKNK